MEYILGYGLMILIIFALCFLNWWKTKPAAAQADRFCLLFLEARDYAIDAPALDPADKESAAVEAALANGVGKTMARYDEQMEAALRALFAAVSSSQHLKTHYFDYLNNLFTIHKLFLQFCAAPDASLTGEDWEDLTRYMGDRRVLAALLSRRMTAAGRRALNGRTVVSVCSSERRGTE